jgi:hypothetical protein
MPPTKKSMKVGKEAAKASTKINAKSKAAASKATLKPKKGAAKDDVYVDSVVAFDATSPLASKRSASSIELDEGSSSKKRRLRKRDSSEQAFRVLTSRLKGVSESIIQNKKDDEGNTMVDITKIAIRGSKSSQNYLATEFWTCLDDAFNIFATCLDCLPDPPENETIQDELFDSITACHSKNRATRHTRDLALFLQYATALNQSELMTLINSSVRGLIVTPKMEREMRHMIVKHMGAHGLHLKFVQLWEAIKDLMWRWRRA